jgi:non-ribosomal peptide synthetase component F
VSEPFLERRPYNAAADFVDANVARGFAAKLAFIDPQRTITYGELQQKTCRFASGLLALGLKAEDRVALLLPDTIDYPGRVLGRDPRRHRGDPAQHLAQARAIRVHARRQPGQRRDRGRDPI